MKERFFFFFLINKHLVLDEVNYYRDTRESSCVPHLSPIPATLQCYDAPVTSSESVLLPCYNWSLDCALQPVPSVQLWLWDPCKLSHSVLSSLLFRLLLDVTAFCIFLFLVALVVLRSSRLGNCPSVGNYLVFSHGEAVVMDFRRCQWYSISNSQPYLIPPVPIPTCC